MHTILRIQPKLIAVPCQYTPYHANTRRTMPYNRTMPYSCTMPYTRHPYLNLTHPMLPWTHTHTLSPFSRPLPPSPALSLTKGHSGQPAPNLRRLWLAWLGALARRCSLPCLPSEAQTGCRRRRRRRCRRRFSAFGRVWPIDKVCENDHAVIFRNFHDSNTEFQSS